MLTLHAAILETRHLQWQDEADCSAFATRLSQHLELRDASVNLHGPLGAGKTSLVRHLLRALGVTGRIKSPTFAVLESHQASDLNISHFDFYRFTDAREWLDAGFRELYAQPGLKLAEWPENAQGFLPSPDLSIHIEPLEGDARHVALHAHSARGVALIR